MGFFGVIAQIFHWLDSIELPIADANERTDRESSPASSLAPSLNLISFPPGSADFALAEGPCLGGCEGPSFG